jgi:glycosyltransferase involved in cell wall biosynthesis
LLSALLATPEGHRFVAFLLRDDLGTLARGDPPLDEVEVSAGKYTLAEHWLLARAAARAGVDLFHAPHYTLPLPLRCPAVVTVHDLIHIRFARFFPPGTALYARTVAGAAVRKARLVLVDSSHVRDDVAEILGVPGDRIRVAPLGVSGAFRRRTTAEVGRFLTGRGLPSDYVLYVGARKEHKNLALLIDALAKIPRRSRPTLVISGSEWSAERRLARHAARAAVSGSIRFSGPLDTEDDLAHLYSGAALYLQPSLEEGFGLPPLEAMACGVPVLSSSAGALPETLGDAAVFLPPRDPDAWAGAIGEITGSADRREELARRGIARARAFTWERTARITMQAYREAAGIG